MHKVIENPPTSINRKVFLLFPKTMPVESIKGIREKRWLEKATIHSRSFWCDAYNKYEWIDEYFVNKSKQPDYPSEWGFCFLLIIFILILLLAASPFAILILLVNI
jgi:hypothetical protein